MRLENAGYSPVIVAAIFGRPEKRKTRKTAPTPNVILRIGIKQGWSKCSLSSKPKTGECLVDLNLRSRHGAGEKMGAVCIDCGKDAIGWENNDFSCLIPGFTTYGVFKCREHYKGGNKVLI